jgi:hypothetical protein
VWQYVIPNFQGFLNNLELLPKERMDAEAKAARIAQKLFDKYYSNNPFDFRCYAIVGSYGKETAARPRTDVDLIFVVNPAEYPRINGLVRGQSALLQEVKNQLLDRWPSTDIRGDGPIVKVPFDSYEFEVCPVFRWEDNGTLFITPHTKHDGWWGVTDPAAEMLALRNADQISLGKATHLVKMLKSWKLECNVDMRSICLETAAVVFINQWEFNSIPTLYYYDWMVRDFFEFLLRYQSPGSWARPAGITEQIPLGDTWQNKANRTDVNAVEACEFEKADNLLKASEYWVNIFGHQFEAEWVPVVRKLFPVGA